MDTMFDKQRVMVIGNSGSGKSTFSRAFANIVGLPLVHLDAHWWNAGWVETPEDEWQQKHEALLLDERWVIDGNYGATMEARLARADAVIWLKVNRFRCLKNAIARYRRYRGQSRPDMCEGCDEKLDAAFVYWILWGFYRKHGKRTKMLLRTCPEKVFVFKSTKQADAWLSQLTEDCD